VDSLNSAEELVRKAVDLGQIPRYLYKYRDTAKTKEIVSSNKLWFANSCSFNDPFDSNLSVNPKFTNAELKRYVCNLIESPAERSISIKRFKRNPEEFVRLSASTFNEVKQSLGTLSLSKTHSDILMWSHYADNHSGQVLELDVLSDLEFFSIPLEMNYEIGYRPLKLFKDSKEEALRNLKTKARSWAYEQEVRIVKPYVGLCSIKREALTKIYFGCSGDDQEKQELIELCKNKGLDKTRFYQAYRKHGKFELRFNKIT
jgi:hypothetical protein